MHIAFDNAINITKREKMTQEDATHALSQQSEELSVIVSVYKVAKLINRF